MGAEIKDILERNDFSIKVDYPVKVKNTLSRGELEDIVEFVTGNPIPENDVKFIIKSLDNKYFLVEYIKSWDKFLWKKMIDR